ncbi:MAG: homoserine kinase [Deltaproteobacteria bacterium]|nr:homoserine kinase [Deltaproteobacteria bacterium]MBW2305732.1 homoserine kinase [Deltaproteobacteria bacterium]
MEWICVAAPASIGNAGPGYDALGVAVTGPGDRVWARRVPQSGIFIKEILGFSHGIPMEPGSNSVGIAARGVLDALGVKEGLELRISKGIPPASGLGSSAASACAGAFAANAVFEYPLPREKLLPFCTESERATSGDAYADNVAASLLGGLVLIQGTDPVEAISLGALEGVYFVVATPRFTLTTRESRGVVPKDIPIKAAVANMSAVASVVAGLLTKDVKLFGRGIQDHLVEPFRSPLIPGFHEIKAAALDAGALGCAISGSGPSIFAVTGSDDVARVVGERMRAGFMEHGLESEIRLAVMDVQGTKIVSPE